MDLSALEAFEFPLYILIDGAVIEGAEKLCYELAINQEIESVYRGTVLDTVANLSPILLPLKNNHSLLATAIRQKPYDWGIVFEAKGSTSEIADHLRTTIKADLGHENISIFRFYLPHVIDRIANASTDKQKHRIFGPISKLWVQSRIDGGWDCTEITHTQTHLPLDKPVNWVNLSDKQLTALSEAAKQHFIYRALSHVHLYFPDYFEQSSPTEQHQKIELYVQQTQEYGLSSEMEIFCFINIICMLGENALEREKYIDIKNFLHNKGAMLPSERIQNALVKATEYYEQRESLDG